MFTVYVRWPRGTSGWQFCGTAKTASEAASRARHYHNAGFQVAIDSPEVPVERDPSD